MTGNGLPPRRKARRRMVAVVLLVALAVIAAGLTLMILGAPAAAHIMVPASAVVDRGQSQFVWVETKEGTYEPREVKSGGRHGDSIVIVSGISDGENVVVEGGFLLDSEARLRGAGKGHTH